MIQRIQTVYLIAAILVLSGMWFFPIAEVSFEESSIQFYLTQNTATAFDLTFDLPGAWPIAVGVAILCVLALATMLDFKNRKRQLMLCKTTLGLLPVLAVGAFLNAWQAIEVTMEASSALGGLVSGSGGYGFAPVLPLVAMVFVFLALKGIQKDEALIRSMDRLR